MEKPKGKISLIEILRSGKFGEICLGDSKEKVIEFLGQPTGYGNPEYNDILNYNSFEFSFNPSGTLECILNKRFISDKMDLIKSELEINRLFELSVWFDNTKNNLKLSSILDFLTKTDINFSVINHNEMYLEIKMTDSKAYMCFDFFAENTILTQIGLYDNKYR
ncbi:MAG: hypothetical protein JXQ87_17885 [Bacteroidia bacterium]